MARRAEWDYNVRGAVRREDLGKHHDEGRGNKELVREAFRPWESGDPGPFFELIADDVRWTVIGTTAASGVFNSKQALVDAAFGPLLGRLDGPLVTTFREVAGDVDRVFLRFESEGMTKRGGIRYGRSTAGR